MKIPKQVNPERRIREMVTRTVGKEERRVTAKWIAFSFGVMETVLELGGIGFTPL